MSLAEHGALLVSRVTTTTGVPPTDAGPAGPAVPDGEVVRATAAEIVARREFVEQRPSLLERFGEWLARQLGRLPLPDVAEPTAGGAPAGGRGGSGPLTVLLVVAGLVVVALVVRSVRRNGWPGRRRSEEPADDGVVLHRAPLGEDELAALAARHEAAGEWPEAVRARYRWAVAALRRHGAVAEEPGRTSGELRREVDGRAPTARGAFGALTDTFETAWYAGRAAGPDDGAAARELAEAVVAAARTRGAVEPNDPTGTGAGAPPVSSPPLSSPSAAAPAAVSAPEGPR